MSKIIKKISLFLTSIGIILLLGRIFSSLFFSDKIENTVVNSIKKQIPKNINIENVEKGIYLVKISSDNGIKVFNLIKK